MFEFNQRNSIFAVTSVASFTEALFKKAPLLGILGSIYSHQFNQQLFDASLDPLIFGDYLLKDYIYLHHFAVTIKTISEKSRTFNPTLADHLLNLSNYIINNEQEMQREYAQYFTYNQNSEPGQAITKYITFLKQSLNQQEIVVSLCAILPCFWVYYQIGKIHFKPSQNIISNPYQNWINTYIDQSFIDATLELQKTIDELAQHASASTLKLMESSLEQAVHAELHFFDEVMSTGNNSQNCVTTSLQMNGMLG